MEIKLTTLRTYPTELTREVRVGTGGTDFSGETLRRPMAGWSLCSSRPPWGASVLLIRCI